MGQQRAFGRPRPIDGKAVTADATLVPMAFLAHVRTNALPINTSGTSNRVFTLAASVTNPVYIWDGNDYIELKENLSHTWSTGSTNPAIATTGATSSANTPGAIGVRYYYVGMATDGTTQVLPSTAKPSAVEGPMGLKVLGHPGPSRTRAWTYVGWNYMSATSPAFGYFLKKGYTYHVSHYAYAGVDTEAGEISAASVPKHDGVRLGGYVTGGATSLAVELGAATDPTNAGVLLGVWKTLTGGVSAAADGVGYAGFDGIPVSPNGIFARIAATATNVNVNITRITDVV
jgi:hypothetical protein